MADAILIRTTTVLVLIKTATVEPSKSLTCKEEGTEQQSSVTSPVKEVKREVKSDGEILLSGLRLDLFHFFWRRQMLKRNRPGTCTDTLLPVNSTVSFFIFPLFFHYYFICLFIPLTHFVLAVCCFHSSCHTLPSLNHQPAHQL